ncbi:hypothetical protein [Shewanella sp. GXUN23E]|uniref:hypothetical protein n=1 Tax=Shewanella sp. GXUN23E TaxID=3422498 RepID=UPI003D7DC740
MTDKDTLLDDLIASAPREITPKRDLWPGIRAQLAPVTTTGFGWKTPVAASLLIAGLLLGWQLSRPQVMTADPALLALVESTRETHQQQMAQIQLQVRPVSWHVSQEQQAIELAMTQLIQAEQQVYQALEQSPQNTALWDMWLWLHQQQIKLLLDNQVVSGQWKGAQI